MKEIKIPFDFDKYNSGNYKIVTRGDKNHKSHKARILSTNLNNDRSLVVALCDENTGYESVVTYRKNGKMLNTGDNKLDLLLVEKVFENGDFIALYDTIIAIFKSQSGKIMQLHAELDDDGLYLNGSTSCSTIRLATKEEIKKLNEAINNDNKVWNYTNKCIEPKIVAFKPMDWCLMRDEPDEKWCLCQFSHIANGRYVAIGGVDFANCIYYNDKTSKLLGNDYTES